MTLEEEIKRLTDNAEYERTHGNLQGCLDFRQLVEWLKELKVYKERMPSYEAGYNDAKREIALSGEYERCYERGKADAQTEKWIPVSEGLPEKFESVLVCYESQGGIAQAVSERFGTHTGYRWSALAGIEPIAWMPLPLPPCEIETEEQKSDWMYSIFNKDKIMAQKEQWTKEAEEAGMTLTEYLESINPLKQDDISQSKMTIDETIKVLENIKPTPYRGDGKGMTHTLETLALDRAIKALEQQQPYEDTISRQAAIDTIESWLSCDDYNESERHIMRAMQSVLYDLPSVTLHDR